MSRKETIAEGVTLYLGDSREILPTIGNVDAFVTSPPYDGLREYGAGFNGFDWRAVIKGIAGTLNPGGVAVWNVADQVVDGSESGTSFTQALYAIECGLRLHDTMIYCKESVTFPDANRYHPAFEYMFVFSAGAPKCFNGIKDWKNKSHGRLVSGTGRQTDGSTKTASRLGEPVPSHSLRRNWWIISNPYTGDTGGHPAPMPYSLAADHIETWTKVGDIVADPFLGSGTAGIAAVKLGRKFTGIEIEPKYFDIACRRISEATKQIDMFAEAAQ